MGAIVSGLLSSPEQSFIYYIHAARAQAILSSKKRKNSPTETAVFITQPVYYSELLEMGKFPFLFVFILDSCLIKTAFCK